MTKGWSDYRKVPRPKCNKRLGYDSKGCQEKGLPGLGRVATPGPAKATLTVSFAGLWCQVRGDG